jgi:hypothetical protein
MARNEWAGEASEVNHRARRQPPTFPARRGMRSAWFRGRSFADDDPAANHDPADAPQAAEPASGRSATEATGEGDTTSMRPMRPVHGHPTF